MLFSTKYPTLASRGKMGKEYDSIIKHIKPKSSQDERKMVYKTVFMNEY